jgi:hypothetical protein
MVLVIPSLLTIGAQQGKWYAEAKVTTGNTDIIGLLEVE